VKKKVVLDSKKCIGCRSCEIACAVEHSQTKNLLTAIFEELPPVPRRKVEYVDEVVISNACHHCEDAPCVAACMSQAMYKDKDGTTQHDPSKCVGCWMCVMVCPFGAIKRQRKVILKCDLCKDREVPACVESCHTKALQVLY
jgi:carbon-monoxide dehydrogenase iron sulfur subunit